MYRRVLPILSVTCILFLACSGDDDSPTGPAGPTLNLSVSDSSSLEGAPIILTISLSANAATDVKVRFETFDGTASSTGSADFTAVDDSVTIAAGTNSATLSITTTEDTDVEFEEGFSLTVTSATGVTIVDALGSATIWDDDGASFTDDIQPLLSTYNCLTGCHGGGSSSGGLALGSASWSEVVNAAGNHGPFVDDGAASTSSFWIKTGDSPPYGNRMPLGQGAVSLVDRILIADWINQGAQNN